MDNFAHRIKEKTRTGFQRLKKDLSEKSAKLTRKPSANEGSSSTSPSVPPKPNDHQQQQSSIEQHVVQLNLSEAPLPQLPIGPHPSSSSTSDPSISHQSDNSQVLYYQRFASSKAGWSNWAGNQSCDPGQIFYPKTLADIQALVVQAKQAGKKMEKCHTPLLDEEGVWTVTVETGVQVKNLDDFLKAHKPPLALPSNVVLDSHGAATHTRTLPDLVTEVTIVGADGHLNTFTRATNPAEFSAATINLGLLGVIYTYTMRVDLPSPQRLLWLPNLGGPKLKAMVEVNDSTELFYWPFNTPALDAANDKLWIKQWQRTKLPVTVPPEQEAIDTLFQNMATEFCNKLLYEYMATHPSCTPFVNSLLFGAFGAAERVQTVADAIHYQAGIENIKCLDMEMAFKCNADYSNVVKAWNYVIDQMYEYSHRNEFPFNLALEMRFVKSPSMLLSNAALECAVYCMMEILSVKGTQGFEVFAAKIAQYWIQECHARPHWAKMWEFIPGIVPYLRTQAEDRFDQFEAVRAKYDPQGMFLNSTFAGLLGH
ncbi:hypothetical protein BG006_006650 [Podila minutissima]|uniref:D-arabinono-1,4-lactone oxidase C-terminal domain-containing protein n=1 Tax=Podila minutissima TaxID=64525 RepID=A0A9P5VQL7_9FUNG|nr:hypothetical protein BG006_006650 [Podila minutissima]